MNALLKNLFKNAAIPFIAGYQVHDDDSFWSAKSLKEAQPAFDGAPVAKSCVHSLIAVDQFGDQIGRVIRSEWVEEAEDALA